MSEQVILDNEIDIFVNALKSLGAGEFLKFRKDEIEELVLDEIVSDIVEETQGIKSFKGQIG
jgi:hypothetical protein